MIDYAFRYDVWSRTIRSRMCVRIDVVPYIFKETKFNKENSLGLFVENYGHAWLESLWRKWKKKEAVEEPLSLELP